MEIRSGYLQADKGDLPLIWMGSLCWGTAADTGAVGGPAASGAAAASSRSPLLLCAGGAEGDGTLGGVCGASASSEMAAADSELLSDVPARPGAGAATGAAGTAIAGVLELLLFCSCVRKPW